MLISIGLPCYNAGRTAGAAIRSILEQTFQDWELIAVDDGSTDDTGAMLESFRDPRIRVVHESRNLGLSARLNQIVDLARCQWIARMDADDLMHPRRLETQLAALLSNPQAQVATCAAYVIDSGNRVLGARPEAPSFLSQAAVLRRNGPIHASLVAAKEWCQRYPYRAHYRRGEDLDLWVRTIEQTTLIPLRERLYFIREDPSFDIGKYCNTLADHRRVYLDLGPRIGLAFTASLLAKSYAKTCVYRTASRLGLHQAIARRRRTQPLSPDEYKEAQRIVDQICETDVEYVAS
jgi:glycosyltransferase involved in cell wall biosynthesis